VIQVRREYQSREINWLLLPDLLNKYRASISENNLREDNAQLLAMPVFEVSTFSQSIVMESQDDFVEFIRMSEEHCQEVEIRLACYRKPGSMDAYETRDPYFRFVWSEQSVFIKLTRTSTREALKFLAEFEGIIQLSPAKPQPEIDEETEPLNRTVFIAHAFDDAGRSYAFQLTKYLSLLGFEVATGEGFSPESVSSKVKRRLMAQEIVIVILSAKPDMTWLIQETSGAEFTKKPIILLIEAGVEFKPGALGDLEYIGFPKGRISDCFTPILEGLRELGFSFS
jgi:hypothetical protein